MREGHVGDAVMDRNGAAIQDDGNDRHASRSAFERKSGFGLPRRMSRFIGEKPARNIPVATRQTFLHQKSPPQRFSRMDWPASGDRNMKDLRSTIRRASLAVMLGFAASAALCQPLPEPVSRDGVLFVTGGIGEDEAKAFQAAAPRYSLRLMFAMPSGSYLSDVDVSISTEDRRPVLHVRTDGPFLFVMLPAGRYRIVAQSGGQKVSRIASVPGRGGVQLNVLISETPARVVERRCPGCSV